MGMVHILKQEIGAFHREQTLLSETLSRGTFLANRDQFIGLPRLSGRLKLLLESGIDDKFIRQ